MMLLMGSAVTSPMLLLQTRPSECSDIYFPPSGMTWCEKALSAVQRPSAAALHDSTTHL